MNNNVYLKLENVKKSLANFELDNVSFSLPKGYIMGLIGSNGAGKTTTIKLILNMLDIENGNIEVLGKDYKENEKEIKQNIGVVFDSNFFVDTWTIKETEQALSVFYHEWNNEKFRLILKRFGLPLSKKINELSRGMQMKLMLACAFSHNAKIYCLIPFVLVMLFVMLPSFIGSLANIISFAMEHDIFINILPILISLFILGVSYCFSIRGYKKRK